MEDSGQGVLPPFGGGRSCQRRICGRYYPPDGELGLYSEYIPGILLAHAKPGKYVQSVGIALTIFEQPIEFRKWDGRIKAVFVLATVDNHAHFNALQTLMKVLAEEEIRGMISDARREPGLSGPDF